MKSSEELGRGLQRADCANVKQDRVRARSSRLFGLRFVGMGRNVRKNPRCHVLKKQHTSWSTLSSRNSQNMVQMTVLDQPVTLLD
ncbi:hypothetical protein PsYK624_086360 [Phanerochaete sordida]|uniref:Uncharacterized protein n=1 Tax=Phanerochaete sordida TaxID=48140 RepID=A0A9P3GB13_9APHY|nr:hypothetical protein PsYK624_086360 [Phanerochaete sordida]